MANKSLSETAAISLLDSYRDTLATETISQVSFDALKHAILGDTSEKQVLLKAPEDALTPKTRNFLFSIPELIEKRNDVAQTLTGESYSRKNMQKMVDSFTYGVKISKAHEELIDRIKDYTFLFQGIAWFV